MSSAQAGASRIPDHMIHTARIPGAEPESRTGLLPDNRNPLPQVNPCHCDRFRVHSGYFPDHVRHASGCSGLSKETGNPETRKPNPRTDLAAVSACWSLWPRTPLAHGLVAVLVPPVMGQSQRARPRLTKLWPDAPTDPRHLRRLRAIARARHRHAVARRAPRPPEKPA